MRLVKEYDERKNEILDAAERLFHTKGYNKCTVNDILKEVDIAKGTFYYYFKSKEEVMDGILERFKDTVVDRIEGIINEKGINPREKLLRAFMSMRLNGDSEEEVIEELHRGENALFHQKTLNQVVVQIAPLLVKIVEEGQEKGIWSCKYPLQYMQIFLAASTTLTDEGIFSMDMESQMKIMEALLTVLEKMLDEEEGNFMKLFMSNMG